MADDANKTLIGAFIVGAVALAVAGVIAFGSGSLFKESQSYVLFFGGSVKGLSVGAPVQMKGVNIGTVSAVRLLFDQKERTFYNRVDMEITPNVIQVVEDVKDKPEPYVLVSRLIAQGLRAKLVLQSFVTGKLLVSLDFFPDTPVNLVGVASDVIELPTLPSDMEELSKTIEKVPFQEIAQKVMNVIDSIEALVTSPELERSVRSIDATAQAYTRLAENLDHRSETLTVGLDRTLADTRKLMATANQRFGPMAQEITGAAGDARQVLQTIDANVAPVLSELQGALKTSQATIQEMEQLVSNLRDITRESSPMMYRVEEALKELTLSAQALRVMADYLAQHPEAILHGKSATGDE